MSKTESPLFAGESTPEHIAIVMDGNGRWARKRFMPRTVGHKNGVKALKNIVEYCAANRLPVLTVFAFSSENWQRPADEVSTLMELFVSSIANYLEELHKAAVRLRFIGDRSRFSSKLLDSLEKAESTTAANKGLQLNVAINYGGRWDIANAAKQLFAELQNNNLQDNDINEQSLAGKMCLAELPDVDLFIRTGGEQRISNFLLWQSAYAELYFSDALWPDFNEAELKSAVEWFTGRQRRFGKTGEQVETKQNPSEGAA